MGFLEEVHNLIGAEAQALYDDLFSDTSLEVGKTLSKRERETKELNHEKSLIYGEVEFASFYRILRKINPAPGGVFYDLGSGTGKAVFAARLTRDFDRCIGIEILSSLHFAAEAVVRRYNEHFQSFLSLSEKQHVSVFEGSFCDFDWSDGDLVFANSTCFSDELMNQVSQLAGRLKPGAIVVTFTKGLNSDRFELLERRRYLMSWGPATVFIHRRLNAQGNPVGPAKLNILPSDQRSYEDDDYDTNVRPTSSAPSGPSAYDLAAIDEDEDDEDEDEGEEEDDDDDGADDGDDDEDADEDADDSSGANLDDIDESPAYYEESGKSGVKSSPKVSPSKIYPEGAVASSKAPALQASAKDSDLTPEESFNMLNSPMDTMLLLRKRNSQHAHPLPSHSPTSKAANGSATKANGSTPPPAPLSDAASLGSNSKSGVLRSPSALMGSNLSSPLPKPPSAKATPSST